MSLGRQTSKQVEDKDPASAASGSASSAGDSLVIPDHELLTEIGRGAYGSVWLGRNALGTLRAIKIIRRSEFEVPRPYEREYEGIRRFEPVSRTHEGLVDLLHVGRDDARGFFYYVMELADEMPGQPGYSPRTLSAELAAHGALPLAKCRRIAAILASALAELHQHGLVHRDVKPSNIVFVGDVPKLADVGLVAHTSEARSFVGTEGFIAPEGPGAPAADVYSLGVVFYVMATGLNHHCFPEPPEDLATRADRAEWLEFQAIIHRACQTNPLDRYRAAGRILDDLRFIDRGQSILRRNRLARFWKVASVIGCLALAAGLLFRLPSMLRRVAGRPQPRSSNPEALVLYDQARYLMNRDELQSHLTAYGYLAQAVKLDSRFIDAYYAMFEIYFSEWEAFPPYTNTTANYHWVAERMKDLAPDSAQYHTAMAWIRSEEWRFEEALDHLEKALRANPNFLRAHGFYAGTLLRIRGDADTALKHFQMAERIDGQDAIILMHLATPYYFRRDYQAAVTRLEKAVAFEPRASGPYFWLGRCHEAQGEIKEALDCYEQAERLSPGADAGEIANRYRTWRDILRDKGLVEMWRAAVRDRRRAPSPDPYEIARLLARVQERSAALDSLEAAYAAHHNRIPDLLLDDCWDAFRAEPRFRALLTKVGIRANR